jgi:maltooligosyltrehalose trehalohydrolase
VAALEAALAVTLLAPMPPLMFMGEEWGATQPFPFFCDFAGALADAVRKGRREEFKSAYERLGDEVPDPLAEQTFRSAVLDWDERRSAAGRKRLDLVRSLLTIRRDKVVPLLRDIVFDPRSTRCEGDLLRASWSSGQGRLRLLANLSGGPAACPGDWKDGQPIWGGTTPATLPSWSVFWSVGAA